MANKTHVYEDTMFQKVITPPLQEFQSDAIQPANYMIQHVGDGNFVLLREFGEHEPSEMETWKVTYEGKTYQYLYKFPSEEEAMKAIRSYWEAIKQLQSFVK